MEALPLRLTPGADLRAALEAEVAARSSSAAFVISAVGSLSVARLRLAGAREPDALSGDFELLTLAGTVARNGAHLHMSVADSRGRVLGGHVAHGCLVRTTAEVLLVLLPDWSFNREGDPATGFAELVVSRQGSHAA
jgi:predicted DNA-binding protein with PD1-like motif